MAIQFRGRPNARNRVQFGSQTHPRFRTVTSRARRCEVCSLPPEERLRIDLALLSGYLSKAKYWGHAKHLADDIVESSKFRDGSYGDLLYGRLERGMLELESIADEAREKGDPRVAILAWKNASSMAETQAKLLGIGVPRAAAKGSLHLHLDGSLKPGDLPRLIDAFQRTQPALPEPTVVDVEAEEVGGSED